MAGDRQPRFYLDSCIFLAYFQNEPDRADDVAELLEKAQAGDLKLFTSVLSLTEVAFVEQERETKSLDPSVEQKIANTLNDEQLVTLIEVNRLVAADARRLVRMTMVGQQKTLKPPDAMHLASALRINATTLYTYDDPLLGHSDKHGMKITTPPKAQPSLFGYRPKSDGPDEEP